MRLSAYMSLNRNILVVIAIAAFSLLGLVIIQFNILNKDFELKQDQIDYSIPSILMDVHDRWYYNKSLKEMIRDFRGTEEFSLTEDTQPSDPMKLEIHRELSRTLAHNYPDMEYEMNVFLSSEFGCLIHNHHNSHLPRSNKIMSSQNHICMCGLGFGKTFDISFNSPNKATIAYSSATEMMIFTVLLVSLVSGAFFYMIFTINRQKKVSEIKNDFINNLTHEFKTPIFSISLAANALKEPKVREDPQRLEKYVGLIEHEGKRLKNQVDKILQMALIDSGNLTVERKLVDLHELIRKEADHFKVLVEDRGGALRLNLESNKSIVMGDETHLRNIIYNLLDNAQKYSEEDPQIDVITSDDEGGLTISIRDNGIGIDDEVQKFVFDKFYRAPTGNIHNVKGFGLGLSYVKSIVEAHSGWIKLKSAFHKGSEFTIYLPTS